MNLSSNFLKELLKLMIRINIKLLLFCLCFLFLRANAWSQVIDSIYYDWTVYEYNKRDEDKKCYIGATVKSSTTSYTGDRNAYILITHFTRDDVEEVSINSGYEYKGNSSVYVLIGNKQFKLFTEEDLAWSMTRIQDKEMIQLMLESDIVRVRSDSAVGTYAIDEYSMKGLTRAYTRMRELCQ